MPSDEAFIVAIKKDDKKESQLEVLATKWTKCDDSVSRLDIYLGVNRKKFSEYLLIEKDCIILTKEASEYSDSENSSYSYVQRRGC